MADKYTSSFCKNRCNKSRDYLQSAKSKVTDYTMITTTECDIYNFTLCDEFDRIIGEIQNEIVNQKDAVANTSFKEVN